MRKLLPLLAAAVAAFAGGAAYMQWRARKPPPPDPPTLITQVREVARLETLDLTLYKKISFEPDPPVTDSTWDGLVNWVRSFRPPKGRIIVFADVHVGLDLSKLDATHMRADGERIELVLPPTQTRVEIRPGDTEVIDSSLDSKQTADLFELAKTGFEREVDANPALKERARQSAERALRGLLLGAGYREVRFVDQLSPAPGAG